MLTTTNSEGVVVAVSKHNTHSFSKPVTDEINLLTGLGVEGDAHCGAQVKHRSRVAVNPAQPNLRQVHLIHQELLDELDQQGFRVSAGVLGENITTRGIDLLGLPTGAVLNIGEQAVVKITGLRNPCKQIEAYQAGLLKAVLDKTDDDELIRKTGIMGVVVAGGVIRAGDAINVSLPEGAHQKLQCV